jgi:hypothetical protein
MFKKLLYAMFVTDRIKLEANQMTITFLALYFVSTCIMLLSGSLAASALFCFMKISTWACIVWLWAGLLWLDDRSVFRDRREDA